MKISVTLAVFLGIVSSSPTEDDTFTDSYEDCLKMAAGFDNTCTDTSAATNFAAVPTASMSCNTNGSYCPTHGSTTAGTCIFTRKLCVSCRKDGDQVMVRTQTNGLPNHCMDSPRQAMSEVFVDYESKWLPSAADFTGAKLNQNTLDSLICNIMRSMSSNIPSLSGWKSVGTNQMNTGWGVSTSGVMIFNGISGEGGDPFYPGRYGRVTDPARAVEAVDQCLAHPQRQGEMHYHMPSPCVLPDSGIDPNVAMTSDAGIDDHGFAKDQDILAWMRKGFAKQPFRSIFGLAKDGRPIYSPHYENGKDYKDCDVDVCNGMKIGGHYSYVSTYFHPYVMGCYGPGDSPNLKQSCSENPRMCKVPANTDNGSSSLKVSAAALALLLFQL